MSGEPSSEDFFVHGFARACFDAGLHEKQASALLTAYMESTSNGMEKEAFWRGIGMALKGLGTAGVGAIAGIGRGAGQIASLPFKHPKATLKGLGALGGLGAAGAGIYGLNRLANSDTAVGRFTGDMLGPDFKNMQFGDPFNPEDVHKFRDAASRPDPIVKLSPDNPYLDSNVRIVSGERLNRARQYALENNRGLDANGRTKDDPIYSPGFTTLDDKSVKDYAAQKVLVDSTLPRRRRELDAKIKAQPNATMRRALMAQRAALDTQEAEARKKMSDYAHKDSQGLVRQQENLTRDTRKYEDQINSAIGYSERARQAKENWEKAHWYDIGAWARNKAYEWRGGGVGSEEFKNAERKINALNEAQHAMNKKTGIGNADLGPTTWRNVSEDGLK